MSHPAEERDPPADARSSPARGSRPAAAREDAATQAAAAVQGVADGDPRTRLSLLQRVGLRAACGAGALGAIALATLAVDPPRLVSNKGIGLIVAVATAGTLPACFYALGEGARRLARPWAGLSAALGAALIGGLGFLATVLNGGWAAGNVTQGSLERGWTEMAAAGRALGNEPFGDRVELAVLVMLYPAVYLGLRVGSASLWVPAVGLSVLGALHWGGALAADMQHAEIGPFLGLFLTLGLAGMAPAFARWEAQRWPADAAPADAEEPAAGSANVEGPPPPLDPGAS